MSIYQYRASVLSVVDGDTIWVQIDLGFDAYQNMSLRLAGINTPEMSTPEGRAARDWLVARLEPFEEIIIETIKDRKEKYGRYLAYIILNDVNINEEMLTLGVAKPYAAPSRSEADEPPEAVVAEAEVEAEAAEEELIEEKKPKRSRSKAKT